MQLRKTNKFETFLVKKTLMNSAKISSITVNDFFFKQKGCKNDTCNQGIGVTDSITDWSVTAVAGLYVLFANLVLVNLVIAMFR